VELVHVHCFFMQIGCKTPFLHSDLPEEMSVSKSVLFAHATSARISSGKL
jgi:hypothetical protein